MELNFNSIINILEVVGLLGGVGLLVKWLIESMTKISDEQRNYFGQRLDDIKDDFKYLHHSLKETSEINTNNHTVLNERLEEFKNKADHNHLQNSESILKFYSIFGKLPCIQPGSNGELEVKPCPDSTIE
jgi:hypothetical protein